MAKKFNGRKMSHTKEGKDHQRCPLCKGTMKVLGGMLRCAEMRNVRGSSRLLSKHGSMKTIRKRLRKGFPDKKVA
jgi:hypothetical protein